MAWRKLGLILPVHGQFPWMMTHAANPTAEVLSDDSVRVYFSTRDHQNRSSIASARLTLLPSPKLVEMSTAPLISPGPPGAFDDSGTSMGCLVTVGETLWLYYLGWNLGVTVPWRNSIGLAHSHDGGQTFVKYSPAPVMDRSSADPFSLSYPWIIRQGDSWRMWYGSNLSWGETQRDMNHVLKTATSTDGIVWKRDGRQIFPFLNPGEYAQARPCVFQNQSGYQMWFTHRGEKYTLGYAESQDGESWTRNDAKADLPNGDQGEWDSDMVTYPCVFEVRGSRYLLYNGNAYGRAGFGLAVWE